MSPQTNRRYNQIGLDRLVRLDWLERTAYLVMAGNDIPNIKSSLQDTISGAFRSNNTTTRGSIDKTITILMKVWITAPRQLRSFQRDGFKLLSRLPREKHIAVHWGMIMAVYPFWGAVATQTGRLLRLQETAVAKQVQRRVREQYGERETVSRRVRYVLRSFVDWNVLKETETKGAYRQGPEILAEDSSLIVWLLEATLRSRSNGSAPIKDLLGSPGIFPFRFDQLSAGQIASHSPRLDIFRHGMDEDLVMLKENQQTT